MASGGKWEVTDDISLTTTYVDRSSDNDNDDGSGPVIQLTPRVIATGRGGRFTADINYAPSLAVGSDSIDPKTLTHELLATGRIEAIRNQLFIGAQATAGVRGTSSTSGPVDAINYNSDGGEQYYSLRLLPEYRQHLNRYADIVSNNYVDIVKYSGDNDGTQSDSTGSYNANLGIANGRAYSLLDWIVQGNYGETDYNDRTDTRRNVSANVGRPFGAHWRLSAGVGYENNDVETTRSDTSGATWDLGVAWTGSPRTSASLNYGNRYYGDSWAGSLSHRSRKVRLGLNYSRAVTNQRQQRLVDSFFFLADEDGNIVTDPNTGAPLLANIPELQETDEDYLNTQLRGIVTITGRRTDVSITGTLSNRDYEVSDQDEDSTSVSVNILRRLGSGYSATLFGRLEKVDGSADGDSDNKDFTFSLSKQFSKRTSASLDLRYFDKDRDVLGDETEKRIGVTLRANLL